MSASSGTILDPEPSISGVLLSCSHGYFCHRMMEELGVCQAPATSALLQPRAPPPPRPGRPAQPTSHPSQRCPHRPWKAGLLQAQTWLLLQPAQPAPHPPWAPTLTPPGLRCSAAKQKRRVLTLRRTGTREALSAPAPTEALQGPPLASDPQDPGAGGRRRSAGRGHACQTGRDQNNLSLERHTQEQFVGSWSFHQARQPG